MQVAMIGLHKRFCDEALFEKAYHHIQNATVCSGDVVLLVTCNRIELYLASYDLAQRHSELIDAIKEPFLEHLEKRFYTFMGHDVLRHLAQVASGLDSLIEGESDIQHQVKKAYEQSGLKLNADGHYLFQKALHISKKLRGEFNIKPLKELPDLVSGLVQDKIKPSSHLVFLGNSDLNRKIYLKLKECRDFQATLVSESCLVDQDFWSEALSISYKDFIHLEKVCGIICATKDKQIPKLPSFETAPFICDLSRPKILSCYPSQSFDYYDLSFFEQKSDLDRLKQKALKKEALDYIHENVKRLMHHRLLKQNYLAI